MKILIVCPQCGSSFERYPCQIKGKKVVCCSRACIDAFKSKVENPDGYKFRDFSKNSKRFSEMNPEWNQSRMSPEIRMKLRHKRLDTGQGKSYEKTFSRHTHRIVAEKMIGRPLKRGEVVHHINRNKRDNNPENLIVFSSQAEHAAWHKGHGGGGAT